VHVLEVIWAWLRKQARFPWGVDEMSLQGLEWDDETRELRPK
jgi:hypothetical protein